MKHTSLTIGILLVAVFLASCVPQQPSGTPMMNGGEMMHGNGMMGSNQAEAAGFLPGQERDIVSLPEAQVTQTIDIQDGQSISLNPTLVRKKINGKEIAMYGYNGQIPGPLLRVKQGSTFTVNVTNDIDLPTSTHWHGIRVKNANDGAVDVTQQAIEQGGHFTYTVTVPDEGIYWYHTHLREDLEQPMGLYGNLLVLPSDPGAYSQVNSEQVLAISDILLDDSGFPVPYGEENADHTLMGRFGNIMLVNGSPDYNLDISKGEVVRFYLTNTANTRIFKLNFGGAKMKLIGSDSGRYEKEQFVDSVTLSPSERAIIDVLFDKTGTYTFAHRTPDHVYTLGTITVGQDAANPYDAKDFSTLTTHEDVVRSIDPFRSSFEKDSDRTLVLDMDMMGRGAMDGHGMMTEIPKDGIEWEDTAGMMNTSIMSNMMKWKMIDQETGAANDKLVYSAKVGDKLKIRIINKKDSPHPMQHPIHFHGQRFLVLSDNGVKNTNLVWKDTVLIPAGHIVDILLDVSNPGDWMFHCHIAEHLSNGMMALLHVQ